MNKTLHRSGCECRICYHEAHTPGWGRRTSTAAEATDCCGGTSSAAPYDSPERIVKTIKGGPVVWACGVTTVPEREELLQRTLVSLAVGGFSRPQVFVERGLKAFGTWWASILELYVRNPEADRYAMFQDDLVCVRNLRQYLDRVPHPERGYWNLFTTRENEDLVRGNKGWVEASRVSSTSHSSTQQTGRGALALVFPRQALLELMTSRHFVERPMDRVMGTRNIDGGVVTAMNKAGYRENVHCPSLVQHTGDESTISYKIEEELKKAGVKRSRIAKSFPGEGFDAMDWLN